MSTLLPPLLIALGAIVLLVILLTAWRSLSQLLAGGGSAARGHGPQVVERARLLSEKQELLTAIRDVRFEHDLGKVSDDDFHRLDTRYRARAREVLRLLDEQVEPYRKRASELIAQAQGISPAQVASRGRSQERKDAQQPEKPAAPVEREQADRGQPHDPSAPRSEVERIRCPECGTDNDSDATFCKKCATRLSDAEVAS